MSPEKQRIAIAEFCGWKIFEDPKQNSGHRYSAPIGTSAFLGRHALPDYLNDLNAMHEAEKLIMDESSIIYLEHLERISCPWHATAAQRAEALLRTLNLWEE